MHLKHQVVHSQDQLPVAVEGRRLIQGTIPSSTGRYRPAGSEATDREETAASSLFGRCRRTPNGDRGTSTAAAPDPRAGAPQDASERPQRPRQCQLVVVGARARGVED